MAKSVLRFTVPVSFDVAAGDTEIIEQKLEALREIGTVHEDGLKAKSVRVKKDSVDTVNS